MLRSVTAENIAIIKKIHIDLGDKMNIFTGETGAGKSIIFKAISFAIGEKANKDIIKAGEDYAKVTIVFDSTNQTNTLLEQFGIDKDENIIISRHIKKDGKTICRINNTIVTLKNLKKVTSMLIDVHGQHDHQSLLSKDMHILYIDKLCDFKDYKQKLKEKYEIYKQIVSKCNKLLDSSKDNELKIDLLKFQIEEIESINIDEINEDELFNKYKKLSNADKVKNNITIANDLIYENKITDLISVVAEISEYDDSLVSSKEQLITIEESLKDISATLYETEKTYDYDEKELAEIENILSKLDKIKRKYGSTVNEVKKYYVEIKEQYEDLINIDEVLEKYKNEIAAFETEIIEICNNISTIRKEVSKELEKDISSIIKKLEMKDANFKIEITKKENFDETGFDNVEFKIDTNNTLKYLSFNSILSGGELSRIMLAIKSITAKEDIIPTMIFDEIDTGISGVTAEKVVKELKNISNSHQVLLISHLPQIASKADEHFYIYKENGNMNVKNIYGEDIVTEIARMFGGSKVTNEILESARQLIAVK